MKYKLLELAGLITPGHTDALWTAVDHIITSGEVSGEDIVAIAREYPREWKHEGAHPPVKLFSVEFQALEFRGMLTSEGYRVTHMITIYRDGQKVKGFYGYHFRPHAGAVFALAKAGQ